VVKLRAERWTMVTKHVSVDQEAINEADAIRAVLEDAPYTACPKCGGDLVELPVGGDVIVECVSGCDWWDAQPDAKRAKLAAYKREQLAAVKSGLIQEERCELCGELESHRLRWGARKALAQDHDHQTGRRRGLLCTRCNTALGSFRDNLVLLQKAMEYLGKYR
jgi:hypothetical protein